METVHFKWRIAVRIVGILDMVLLLSGLCFLFHLDTRLANCSKFLQRGHEEAKLTTNDMTGNQVVMFMFAVFFLSFLMTGGAAAISLFIATDKDADHQEAQRKIDFWQNFNAFVPWFGFGFAWFSFPIYLINVAWRVIAAVIVSCYYEELESFATNSAVMPKAAEKETSKIPV